ncbi:uncharacterized protein I206_106834 [Kwoniella pini CBS 10737]|uniref:Uncharacterized protein n=1 Tax=Kwoniella pini CBS 10737 TaxID=1296096 RepID=A0AAJ8LB06_9TREE
MNARKVYETPELFSGILQFVERRQFWRVLALERSSFEAAARELWRNVNYQFAKKVINEHTYRSQVYKNSIRYVTLTDSDPPVDKNEASQIDMIEYLIRNLPLLIRAEKRSKLRTGKRKYDWIVDKLSEGQYKVDLLCDLPLTENLSLRPRSVADQQYPGLAVSRTFRAVLEAPKDLRNPVQSLWGVPGLDDGIRTSRFGLNKIDSVITYISETFPNLYHLELPFSINGPDHNFIPVTQIRVVQSLTTNRLNNLERVVINISSTQFMSGRDVRYPFPLEDVAANLAALGANETCIYELRNNSPTFIGMDMSRRLNKEVHDIQKIQR